MQLRRWIAGAATALALVAGGVTADADEVADHFRGRTVSILIGFSPGGGYDLYARMLARYYGKYIPGNPNIVPQNMPGGGSLKVANYIYNAAPKDGATLGMFAAQAALEPLFGNPQAKFETVKFAWIGNMNRDVASCGAWKTSGIETLDDLLKSEKEVVFGATGQGATSGQHAMLLKAMVGAKVKLVQGYKGIKDVGLAMQRGEVHASCGLVQSAINSAFVSELESGDLRIFVQFGRQNVRMFGKATNFYTALKSEEDRQLADLFFGQTEISRAFAAPPGTPAPIVAALRKAMVEVLKDPALIADAKKTRNDIVPMTGEEVTQAYARFYRTPPALLQRAKELMGRK